MSKYNYTMMVDVDSTLYDADALFYKLAQENDDLRGVWTKKSYQWFKAPELGIAQETLTNFFRYCHSREIVSELKPYKGSVEILNQFVDRHSDVKIWYVSSRNPKAEGPLQEWIEAQGYPFSSNVKAMMGKEPWILKNKPAIVIDDRVKTIIYARFEVGAHVLTLKHNHNINLTSEVDGVWVCDDWYEIGYHLENPVMNTIGVTHGTKVKTSR